MTFSIEREAAALRARYPVRERVGLAAGRCSINVLTNDAALAEALHAYFGALAVPPFAAPDLVVEAFQGDDTPYPLDFVDWEREPGKTRRKEATADLPDGRVVHKVRTNMQFLIGRTERVAVGDCRTHSNQVINFVCSQYINWLHHRGWVLCHAAGVVRGEGPTARGLGLAAVSGGGKSTLALHLMNAGFGYTSNDRLLVRRDGASTAMSGVPKLPRINPGTALANPTLRSIVSEARRRELEALPLDALWELEEKYDVFVEARYGRPPQLLAPLEAFLILTWSRKHPGPPELARVDLAVRPDLLEVVMKPPGPFYVPADGSPPRGVLRPHPPDYVDHFSAIAVYELAGGVDFDAAITLVQERILPAPGAPRP